MKYIVQEPLRHDGEDFPVGSTIEIGSKAAASLVAAGVLIEPATAKAKAEAEAQAKAEAEAQAKAEAEAQAKAEAEAQSGEGKE